MKPVLRSFRKLNSVPHKQLRQLKKGGSKGIVGTPAISLDALKMSIVEDMGTAVCHYFAYCLSRGRHHEGVS